MGFFLTFPPLPLLHDGLQPRLLLLRGLGHADKPLVLGRVVDLPAVVHDVPAAVVVGCEAQKTKVDNFDFAGVFIMSSASGMGAVKLPFFFFLWSQIFFIFFTLHREGHQFAVALIMTL